MLRTQRGANVRSVGNREGRAGTVSEGKVRKRKSGCHTVELK